MTMILDVKHSPQPRTFVCRRVVYYDKIVEEEMGECESSFKLISVHHGPLPSKPLPGDTVTLQEITNMVANGNVVVLKPSKGQP